MQPVTPAPRTLADWIHGSLAVQIATVVAGYALCASFASMYAMTRSGVVVLWLPNAVVLSAMLLTPMRRWWMFALAMVLTNVLVASGAAPLWMLLGQALGNLFEVLLSALLIRWGCGRDFAFSNLREVVLFGAFAGGLAPGLATLFGTGIQVLAAPHGIDFLEHWQVWWMGDAMGLIVLTPLLYGWLCQGAAASEEVAVAWWERLAYTVLLAGLLYRLFFPLPDPQSPWMGSPLLLLPMFLWAAMRFGTRGVALVGCVVCLLAIVLSFQGRGMFAQLSDGMKTRVLQQYLAALLLSGLSVAAILNDLRLKYLSLQLFKQAIDHMGEGLLIADARQPDLPIVYCNPKFEEITGYHRSEIIGSNCRFLNHGNRAQDELQAVRQHLADGQVWSTTLQNFRKNGQMFWNQLTTAPVRNAQGQQTHVIGIQRDVSDIRRAQQDLLDAHASLTRLNQELEERVAQRTAELQQLATTDSLTNAYNRRFLMQRAAIEIAQAERQAQALSMVMFDVDHFKRINDSHGHSVGDRVLVAISQAVMREMRPGDTFARVGGEEFVLLLPRSDTQQALQVAERLRQLLQNLQIAVHDDLTLQVTASFGVSTLRAQRCTVDALCAAADAALYGAKAAGRNRVLASST